MKHAISRTGRLWSRGVLAGGALACAVAGPAEAQLTAYSTTIQTTEVGACMTPTKRKPADLHRCVCTLDVVASSLTAAEYDALVAALGGTKLTTTTTAVTLSSTTKLTTTQRTTATSLLTKFKAALEKAKTECL